MKYIFIINRSAGKGNAEKIIPNIEKECKKRNYEYEIRFIEKKDKQKGKTVNTVYIGGGTPTTLEAEQLNRLLTHLENNFSFADSKNSFE